MSMGKTRPAAKIIRSGVLVALLAGAGAATAHGHPVVWGGTPCTADGSDSDGCYNGGSIQIPTFFRGYAVQGSAGTAYPAGTSAAGNWNAAASLQPQVYPVRPPWNVAGVDYAVGMPRWQMPNITNLHPAWLKDPAQIASDPLANPDGVGADCTFVMANSAVAGGVAPGTTAVPKPFPNDGPGIYCNKTGGSTHQLIFDGYNFAWNSATGFGCVPVFVNGVPWGSGTPATGGDTASVVFRNSLFVNGPKCNIYGATGNGTNQGGPNSPSSAWMISIALSGATVNTLGFHHNTVFGCGGDGLASALEIALCSATFNSTSYSSGALTNWVQSARVGVAPFQSIVAGFGGQSSLWVYNNAFMHMTSRFSNPVNVNIGGQSEIIANNYIEGMTYTIGPVGLQFTAIVNSGGTTETATTLNPHGIPIGSSWLIALAGNGALGWPNWPATFTMTATGSNTLTFTSPVNKGDWSYGGSGNYPVGTAGGNHGELTEAGASIAGATFTGTVSGTTLTVAGLSGTLAVGQYVTAATGSGLSLPSPTYIVSGSGNTWTLNQAPGNMTGAMVAPYYAIGGGGQPTTIQYSYNTMLMTPSTAANSNTAFFYVSTGSVGETLGVPLVQWQGSIDHNVMVDDLTPGFTHRSTSALVEFAYNSLGSLAISKNYVDPTGALYCWPQLQMGPGLAPTFSGNVNLLKPADAYINQQDIYAVVGYSAGTTSDSQAFNGISYNSATGVVTVSLANAAMPAAIGVGSTIAVGNATVSTGTNYLTGLHTVTSIAGNQLTFAVGTGFPGLPTGIGPTVTPYITNGAAESCFGHN